MTDQNSDPAASLVPGPEPEPLPTPTPYVTTILWQPIATAPLDGRWVFLAGGVIEYGWDDDSKPPMVVGRFTDGPHEDDPRWHFAYYDSGYYGEYERPTLWAEIPEVVPTGTPS